MKQLLRFSIMLLAILLSATATAHDFEVDSIYYNIINNNEVEVTYGRSYYFHYLYSGTVTIPATVTYDGNTYSVTAIGDYAFSRCPGLTGVDIPNSVTEIGYGAFAYCDGLTSIDIPNSVTSIGYEAFMDCTGLTSIDIPNSVTAISSYAFYNTAWYDNQPDGLVYAGMVAYKYKGTMPSGTNMTLKEGTLGIAVCAFMECPGLTSIVIPNSVTEVGVLAFMDCPGLTSIVVESGNPRYDSRNNCNAIIESASNTLFVGCKNTIIPNSVTSIGDWAFAGCDGLTSIDIPNSVTSIGDCAFLGCDGLTSIDIPNSVTPIGDNAFTDCIGLASIVIPNSLTEVDDFAFAECTGLTDVYCYIADPSRASSWNGLFYLDDGDYSGRTLHVLQGTGDAYRADRNWYRYFEQIVEDIFLGDVNRDLEVSIADVNAVINMILGGNTGTAAADVNGDGEINIADLNAVIDIILSGTGN